MTNYSSVSSYLQKGIHFAVPCQTEMSSLSQMPCTGGFDTEKEAALAYDIACVRFRGGNAQTNFDIAGYSFEMEHLDDVSAFKSVN